MEEGLKAGVGCPWVEGGIRRFIFVNLLKGFRTGWQKGAGDVNQKMKLVQK